MNAAIDISQRVHDDQESLRLNALRTRMVTMEITPDWPIVEHALCEQHGISHLPVRERLRHMAAEGYIEPEADRSPRVATLTCHTLRHFSLAAPLIYSSVVQLATVTATLEPNKGRSTNTRFLFLGGYRRPGFYAMKLP